MHSLIHPQNENLFDKHKAGNDVKYLILLHLNQYEILAIVTNISSEWNSICKSTFADNRFKYTFDTYWKYLLKNRSTCVGIEVFVECPWNRLWTYGTVTEIGSDGITVSVETFNLNPSDPFTSNTVGDNTELQHERVVNAIRFPNLDWYIKRKAASYFGDGYHHIAPINTIDKYRKVTNISLVSKLVTPIKDPLIDYYQRPLCDAQTGFYSLLWQSGMDVDKSGSVFRCGVVDIKALDLYFPKWQNALKMSNINDNIAIDNNENENKDDDCDNDESCVFQIPVLIDVTTEIMDESKFLLADIDAFFSKNKHLYKFGNNRYCKRIWIHPNDSHLIQPFGTKCGKSLQRQILGNTLGGNNKFINKINSNLNYYALLSVKEIIDKYLVILGENEEINFDEFVKENKVFRFEPNTRDKCDAVVIQRSETSDNINININNYKSSSKYSVITAIKHPDYVVKENKPNVKLFVDFSKFPNFDENKLGEIKTHIYYRYNMLEARPMLNFDCQTFIRQYNRQKYLFKGEIKEFAQSLINAFNVCQKPRIELNQIFLLRVKPFYVKIEQYDGAWKSDQWDNLVKQKYKINDTSYKIDINKWKIGAIIHQKCRLVNKNRFIKHIYGSYGESPIYFELTDEFNQFQNTLKIDWLAANPDKEEKHWDNHKFFCRDVWINEQNKRIFMKYTIHCDIVDQVMPYYF